MLGLAYHAGVPVRPSGPSLACRIRLEGDAALVQLSASSEDGNAWTAVGKKFSVPLVDEHARPKKAAEFADELALAMLDHLTNARLLVGPKVQGKPTYKIRVDNASPLILNGLALAGANKAAKVSPAVLTGFSLPPYRSLTVPAGADD